jgi:hypothetical protein
VLAELLWFVSGCTSSLSLSDVGIKIWDGNGSREFAGLSHRETDGLGPEYGFQWRHFGAEYVEAKTDYTGQSMDQLVEAVRKLKELGNHCSPFNGSGDSGASIATAGGAMTDDCCCQDEPGRLKSSSGRVTAVCRLMSRRDAAHDADHVIGWSFFGRKTLISLPRR